MMTLGERIKRLRQERDWSQAQLGQRLGIHQKQVSGYERDVHVPSTELMIRLADALEVTLDYLASGTKAGGQKIDIADRDLLQKMQAVDKLDEEDRFVVKQLLEAFLFKRQVKEMAAR